MRTTPDIIRDLKPNEIFVFGSNEAGIHGAGAAKLAADKFGAVYGIGFGLMGKSFAIPTKDENIETLPLDKIKSYVDLFLEYTKTKPYEFLVTQIGCGLAGYTPKDIAPLFKGAPDNVILPQVFLNNI
jgi:hypothetical protein